MRPSKKYAHLKFSAGGTGTCMAMAFQARTASLKQTMKHDYTMTRIASHEGTQ
jgi:hypothetical protein